MQITRKYDNVVARCRITNDESSNFNTNECIIFIFLLLVAHGMTIALNYRYKIIAVKKNYN